MPELTKTIGNQTFRIVDLSYKMHPGMMERYFEIENIDVLGAEGVEKYHKGHKRTRSTEAGSPLGLPAFS